MQHRVAIYVPRPEWVREVAEFLSKLFGGCTALPGHGYWVNQNGELVEDRTHIVYSWCNGYDEKTILEFAKMLREKWGEEAIAVELDTQLVLVA